MTIDADSWRASETETVSCVTGRGPAVYVIAAPDEELRLPFDVPVRLHVKGASPVPFVLSATGWRGATFSGDEGVSASTGTTVIVATVVTLFPSVTVIWSAA
jgi:hypothetical protein